MKSKFLTLGILLGISITFYYCKKASDAPQAVVMIPSLPATPDLYYSGITSYNEWATLGRVLFYDSHLSVNNAISCGSCHKQAAGFADNVAFSLGDQNALTRRNSLSIQDINSDPPEFNGGNPIFSAGSSLFWDGRENNIGNLIMRPVTNHVEMGITDTAALAAKIAAIPFYANLFNNAFGSPQITASRISVAIAMFVNAIKTGNSRFEIAFNNGGLNTPGTLTNLEIQGMQLFETKYNCNSCHQTIGGSGMYSTSFSFMNNGLDVNDKDPGLGALTGNPQDIGKFKAPELHNIAITAPYMHDGRFKTLDDVLDFYSGGIQNNVNLDTRLQDQYGQPLRLNISSQDRMALKAFLNSLTDYTMITDPKFSNPFVKQ